MKILNLISYTERGLCQNIGDSFTSLALKHYLGKNHKWVVGRFNETSFDLDRFDLVILGGGGIYHPHLLQLLTKNTNWQETGTPLAISGVGMNLEGKQKMSAADNRLLVLINKRAFASTVRDKWSKNHLKALGIKSSITGCPSMFLPEIYKIDKLKKFDWGINLAMHHTAYYSDRAEGVEKFGKRLVDTISGSKIVICHSKDEKKVYKKMFPGLEVYYSDKPKDVFSVYSSCRAVVGMRGHSQIFSLAVGTPSICVPFNEKVAQPVKMTWSSPKKLTMSLGESRKSILDKTNYLMRNLKQISNKQKKLKKNLRLNFYRFLKDVGDVVDNKG